MSESSIMHLQAGTDNTFMISIAMVPCPAMTSGSSKGCTIVRPCSSTSLLEMIHSAYMTDDDLKSWVDVMQVSIYHLPSTYLLASVAASS